MFESVHNKLIKKSKLYRDWHRSPTSGITNAFLFTIFSFYLSAVVWVASNPGFLKESEELKVLGVSVGPSNLAHEMDRNEIIVSPIETEDQFSILVTTKKDSSVWIEYDGMADGYYLNTQKTPLGKTHLINLWQYEEGRMYVYRVVATDSAGYTVYSREYSFIR